MNNKIKVDNSDVNENARVEYAVTNDVYLNSDNFAWQVGSLLFAGVFVYWGFTLSASLDLTTILVSNLLVCFLMSVWLFYTEHNRQIYLFKLHRIWELEKQLNMCQHLRFKNEYYKLDAPLGHHLYRVVYIIISFGGLFPEIIKKRLGDLCYGWNIFFILLTIIIVISVLLRANRMSENVKSRIIELDAKKYNNPDQNLINL